MQAYLMLFPSESEGWPKVLSEGKAYGVVPVTSDVSSIPQYLREFGHRHHLQSLHSTASPPPPSTTRAIPTVGTSSRPERELPRTLYIRHLLGERIQFAAT